METPLEKYLTSEIGKTLSNLPNEFAIGTDNVGSALLMRGIAKFKEAIPQTLAGHLLNTGKAWTQTNNDEWVLMMIRDKNMKFVHIYHEKICDAIQESNWENLVSWVRVKYYFQRLEGNQGPTFKEMEKIILGGNFVIVEREHLGYAKLRRHS